MKLEEIRETPFEVHQINAINVVFSHVARNPVKIELEFEEWQFREPSSFDGHWKSTV